MFTKEESKIIARLIVGAATIDGTLNSQEREQLSTALIEQGFTTVVAEVGAALDEDFGDFDIFRDSKKLLDALGSKAPTATPKIFKIIATSITGDRFVSEQEASFLSALSRRLKISTNVAGKILKEILEANKGKLEISGEQVDALIHPHLKELLSFIGSDELVGEIKEDSLDERLFQARKDLDKHQIVSKEEIDKALITLGLNPSSSIDDAKDAWENSLSSINFSKLIFQGINFVSAALTQAKTINDAYAILASADTSLKNAKVKKNEVEILAGKKKRAAEFVKESIAEQLDPVPEEVE